MQPLCVRKGLPASLSYCGHLQLGERGEEPVAWLVVRGLPGSSCTTHICSLPEPPLAAAASDMERVGG